MMIAANNGSFPWTRDADSPHPDGEVLDRVTRDAIEAQTRAGLDLLTDGLVRRRDPVSHLVAQMDGVELGETRDGFPGGRSSYRVPVVTGGVVWRKPFLVEDFLFARSGSRKPVKPVLAGPYTLARVAEDRAYNDRMALALGFAIALNTELKALQAAGATWVQIDEPAILDHKEEFPVFTRVWEVLGRGLDLTLCLHLEGGDIGGLYPGVTRLKRLGCLSLDCVRGRASLDLFKDAPFPETLMLGLGLVDGGSTTVESPEAIASLLRSTVGLPPGARIVLGTASDLGRLTRDTAFSKLQTLARARELAS